MVTWALQVDEPGIPWRRFWDAAAPEELDSHCPRIPSAHHHFQGRRYTERWIPCSERLQQKAGMQSRTAAPSRNEGKNHSWLFGTRQETPLQCSRECRHSSRWSHGKDVGTRGDPSGLGWRHSGHSLPAVSPETGAANPGNPQCVPSEMP